jgi:DNA (cytosine-5)-methyltransferase 1
MSRPKPLVAFDLFAGCGGLSLGFTQAGLDVRWANEINPAAAQSYALNHPGTRLFNCDLAELFERFRTNDRDLPQIGEVDLVAGGPPCQGFSGYNRYRRPGDPRNSLMGLFLDVVELLAPPYVLIENVVGLLSMADGKAIQGVMARLTELKYTPRLGILQAGHYGLPQNRWRVFVWAGRGKHSTPEFPEPTHLFPRKPLFGATAFKRAIVVPPSQSPTLFWKPKSHPTVWDAIGDLPPIRNGSGEQTLAYSKAPQSDFQTELRKDSTVVSDHQTKKLDAINMERVSHIPKRKGASWTDLPDHLKPANLTKYRENSYDNRFGRLHKSATFNTILTRPEPYWGCVIHPTQDRVISIRESARAQGFPDTYRLAGSMTARYAQIGNAVPPLLARAIASQLLAIH